MSKWHYIASAQKPSAIRSAHMWTFTGEPNLILGKINSITVYTISGLEVRPHVEIPINAKIEFMSTLWDPPSGNCWLIVITRPYRLLVFSWEQNVLQNKFLTDLQDPMGKISELAQFACSQDGTQIAMQLYDGKIKFANFSQTDAKTDIKDFCDMKIDDAKVKQIIYVKQDTIALLYNDKTGWYIKTYNMHNKYLEEERFSLTVVPPTYLFRLDARPECLGVFTSHAINLYDTNSPGDSILRESKQFGTISAITQLIDKENEYMVGNRDGELWHIDIQPYSLQIIRIGRVCSVQSLVHLGGSLFFVGSLTNDSILIQITTNQRSGSFKLLNTIPSLAPISDLWPYTFERPFDYLICTGKQSDRTLRIARKGVNLNHLASMDGLEHVRGIWSIKSANEEAGYEYLLLSYPMGSVTLQYTNGTYAQLTLPGIFYDEETIVLGNQASNVVQITSSYVRWLSYGTFNIDREWMSGATIQLAGWGPYHVVISTRDYVSILTPEVETAVQVPSEVSCISCSESSFALGFWLGGKIRIYNYSGEVLHTEDLGISTSPVSIMLTSFNYSCHVIVGLGDGKLITYDYLDGLFLNKSIFQVGTLPVKLKRMEYRGDEIIFICSDQPCVMYEYNHRTYLCNVINDVVAHCTSFSTPDFPGAFFLLSGTSLHLYQLMDLRKMSYIVSPLTIKAKKCIQQKNYTITLAKESGQHTVRLHDARTFETLDTLSFNSQVKSMCSQGDLLFLGQKTEGYPKGKLAMYDTSHGLMQFVSEVDTEKEVAKLSPLRQEYVLSGSWDRLNLWKASRNGLQKVCEDKCGTYIIAFDICGDYIAMGDCIRSVTLWQFSNEMLRLVARAPATCWINAVKFLDWESILASDLWGNIFMLSLQNSKLVETAAFHLGDAVTCIRSGSLVQFPFDLDIKQTFVYATGDGALGVIAELGEELYDTLTSVQNAFLKYMKPAGDLSLTEYRQPYVENKKKMQSQWRRFIDGDFLEGFLHLNYNDQKAIWIQADVNVEDFQSILHSLNRLH